MAKIGRPKIYETPEQMEEVLNKYFLERENECKPLTIESMCVALGMDRSTLLTYGRDESHKEFHNTIKRAKDIVLSDLWDRAIMNEGNVTACIFNFKNNYNYADKTEQEVTSNNITTVVLRRADGEPTKFAHSEDEIDD